MGLSIGLNNMNYIQVRMAMIFDEWAKRYVENYDGFDNILDNFGKPVENYGLKCAIYFEKLADEMDESGLLPLPPE
jgi:hypothetical protein